MKEIVLYITDISMISKCDNPNELLNGFFEKEYGYLYQNLLEYVDYQKANRIYFGNEFCEHLMPNLEEVKKVIEYTEARGMKFSLVTSCAFNSGVDKVLPILEYLNSKEAEIEVICNDWGIVQLIYDRFPNLKIVLGRLMDKMSREPRITQEQFEKIYGIEGLRFLQTPNIFVEQYQEILNLYNINRLELDCVPQGLSVEGELYNGYQMNISLYFPFYYVTTGAMCMMKFMTRTDNDKYNIAGNCAKLCKYFDKNMKKSMYIGDKNREICLYSKGNTIYNKVEDFSKYVGLNDIIDRYIVQFF